MLPLSGPMSMTLIATEAGKALNNLNVNNADLRSLARVTTVNSAIKWSDFYGRSRYEFVNGNFIQGTFNKTTTPATILGWRVYISQVKLNGLSTIEGWPSPTDNIKPANNSGGDNHSFTGPFYADISTDVPPGLPVGTRSMRLYQGSGVSASYAIIHGPYLVSDVNNTAPLDVGDTVSFYWKALGGNDAYDVYAYLLNVATGATIQLFNQTGASAGAAVPWTRVSKVIAAGEAGTYKFVFISGSYDASGGTVLNASLLITNVTVAKV